MLLLLVDVVVVVVVVVAVVVVVVVVVVAVAARVGVGQHFVAPGETLTPRKEFATFYFTSAKACPCGFGGFSSRCELEDHVE